MKTRGIIKLFKLFCLRYLTNLTNELSTKVYKFIFYLYFRCFIWLKIFLSFLNLNSLRHKFNFLSFKEQRTESKGKYLKPVCKEHSLYNR